MLSGVLKILAESACLLVMFSILNTKLEGVERGDLISYGNRQEISI